MVVTRCQWVPANHPLYIAYHDEGWGVPLHDDDKLFEMLDALGRPGGPELEYDSQ